MTIHPQRGGRYWYYWVVIIGGLDLAVAGYITFGAMIASNAITFLLAATILGLKLKYK